MASLLFLAAAAILWGALPQVPAARAQMARVCRGDPTCLRRRSLFLQGGAALCVILFIVRAAQVFGHLP